MNAHPLSMVFAVTMAWVGACATAGSPKSTLEFRLAVTEPTDGYVEKNVPTKSTVIYVSRDTVATGIDIERVSFYDDQNGNPAIGFVLTDDGSKRFWNATSANTGKKLAILLDDKVVSAPNIMQGIKKNGVITGRFDDEDLTRFFSAIVLRKAATSQKP